MINNNILNQKVILMIGQYGSGKTTFLSKIYDFLMNFKAIEDVDIQNEKVKQLLRRINFYDYEVIYIQASGEKDFKELLYRSLLPLIQRINLKLEETEFKTNIEGSLKLIIKSIKDINPDTSILILLDGFELLIMNGNKVGKRSNLTTFQNLIVFIHANTGLKLIISSQTEPEFVKFFQDRMYLLRV